MKKLNKRKIILIFVFICIGLIFIFAVSYKKKSVSINGGPDKEGGLSYNSDGTVTLGEGMVSNGFYDIDTGKIVNQGTLINPIDGKIKGEVSFNQNIPGVRNYLLIIMIDYVQQQFIVDGNTYSNFPFSLEGKDSERIKIEVPVSDLNSNEFEYMIISEPDIKELSISDKNEWNKLLMTTELRTWRLPIVNSYENKLSLEYDSNYKYIGFNKQGNDINLTKTHQNIIAMPTCESMESVELVLGNASDEEMNYVLLAFLNWNQVSIIDDDMTKFVTLPPKSNIYYQITTAYVDSDSAYQIFAFPKPFEKDFNYAPPPTSTLRTIIKPTGSN